MPKRIAVYSPDGMDRANHILRESDRENNNGSRSDKDSFHPPTSRVFFEITSLTLNSRDRYPGKVVELTILEQMNTGDDFWTDGDVIEVIVKDMTPELTTLYEGVVVGTTSNELNPVVVLVAGGAGTGTGGGGVGAMITGVLVTPGGSELPYYPATADTAPAGGPWVTGSVIRVINTGTADLKTGKRYPAVKIGTISSTDVYAAKGAKTSVVTDLSCSVGTIFVTKSFIDIDIW